MEEIYILDLILFHRYDQSLICEFTHVNVNTLFCYKSVNKQKWFLYFASKKCLHTFHHQVKCRGQQMVFFSVYTRLNSLHSDSQKPSTISHNFAVPCASGGPNDLRTADTDALRT